MKIGKVFDKLAARKNVAQITFGENTATVHLTNGSSLLCKSAHEARLFIEQGKQPAGSLVEVPAPSVIPAVLAPRDETIARLADNAVAACGTEARTITLDADYVRIRGGGLIEVPYDATNVRVTPQTAAALIVGGFDY